MNLSTDILYALVAANEAETKRRAKSEPDETILVRYDGSWWRWYLRDGKPYAFIKEPK